MVSSIDAYDRDDHQPKMQNLRTRMRLLEGGLLFAIVGMILLATKTLLTPSSILGRVQEMEDAFQLFSSWQQKMDDRIALLSTEEKAFLQELKEEQNGLIKRFEKCEKKTFDRQSNSHNDRNYFETSVDNVVEKQYDKKIKNKKNQAYEESKYKSMLEKVEAKERLLQINQISSDCNENLFQFSLRLDEYPQDTVWKLFDSVNEMLVTEESYSGAEAKSYQNSTICISDGSYEFTITDSYRDGICVEIDECKPYNISINNELFIEGFDFGWNQIHNINIYNRYACAENVIELQVQMDENIFEGSWNLIDPVSTKVLANRSQNTVCIDDGNYLFRISNRESENVQSNRNTKILVNGIILIDEPISSSYQFLIIDGLAAPYYHCFTKPILNPINGISGNIYNERVSKLLEIFASLSSHGAIHNDNTPQYKAACYILFDDINEMRVENELTFERYILYLFLISTKVLRFGDPLPPNFCDFDGVGCNDDGYIIELIFRKYVTSQT